MAVPDGENITDEGAGNSFNVGVVRSGMCRPSPFGRRLTYTGGCGNPAQVSSEQVVRAKWVRFLVFCLRPSDIVVFLSAKDTSGTGCRGGGT